MVNEVEISDVKRDIKGLQKVLRERFDELKNLEGTEQTRSQIFEYYYKLENLYQETDILDSGKYRRRFNSIKNAVKKKFGIYYVPEEIRVTSVEEPKEKANERSSALPLVFLVGVLCLGAGIIGEGIYLRNKDANRGISNEETTESTDTTLALKGATETEEETEKETENEIETKSDEETNSVSNTEDAQELSESEQVNNSTEAVLNESLKPGEYGTLLNIRDDEAVMARAQFIYDNYFAGILDDVSPAERQIITVENIANVIRTNWGICPEDENGYKFNDGNTHITYGQRLTEFVSNIPSSDVLEENTGRKITFVPGFLFAQDGSEEQEFIASYDMLYNRIAEARNNNDSKGYRAAAKIIAAKYLTEWLYQGMRGYIVYQPEIDEISYASKIIKDENIGKYVMYELVYDEDTKKDEVIETILDDSAEVYTVYNPYNFNASHRFIAYQATMTRYASFIKEAEFNQMATICIPACTNYGTKLEEELSIIEIYTAIDDGVWSDIIAKSAGIEVPKQIVMLSFLEDLEKALDYDYSHQNVPTLTENK